MKINLEIIDCSFVYDKESIDNLKTKELVPKMVTRRRLTKASKIVIFLANEINSVDTRIMYGTSYGEIPVSANILDSIKNKEQISPTYFQNSVFNTSVSYLSMLTNNKKEIMTIVSGDDTSKNILKAAASKIEENEEITLIVTETLNFPGIEQVNKCIDFLECGVALKVKLTTKNETISFNNLKEVSNFPRSVQELVSIAKQFDKNNDNIIGVEF
jgi:hypothetical protein